MPPFWGVFVFVLGACVCLFLAVCSNVATMLSMCSLVCRLVRGWKQSEATSLISQATTTPGSSLLLHDLSEPDLNVEIGSYVASPYPQIDVLLQPYKYMRRDSYSNHGSQQHMHSAFCQTFSWPEGKWQLVTAFERDEIRTVLSSCI